MSVVTFDVLRDARHRSAPAARECADWLAFRELEGKAPRTRDDGERAVATLLRMFPLPIGAYTEAEITHVLKSYPPGSRRTVRSHLNSFFKWARSMGHIERNPMERVPQPRRPAKKIVETFTEAEEALLTSLPSPDGPLMLLLFDSGLRKGEARRLRGRHIDFQRQQVIVMSGKGGKGRVIPMTKRLAEALADMFLLEGIGRDDHLWYTKPGGGSVVERSRPIGEGSFHRWYTRCEAQAEVDHRNPHTTRHTFALRWLRNGGRLETLSLVLGHESIKTTFDEYGHLDMTDVLADLRLVESPHTTA